MVLIEKQKCFHCGALSADGRTCLNCRRHTHLDGLIVATYFDYGPVREMVHAFKYHNAKEVAEILGALISHNLNQTNLAVAGDVMVVPVPLHPKRLAERGFNQAEILASKLGRPVSCVLRRVRSTISQTGLHRMQRQANVRGAFVCLQPLQGEVLLVDDVATTGATLDECARILKLAGAKRVSGVVVARG